MDDLDSRMGGLENNFIRLENSVESLSSSLNRLVDTIGDYKVIADRTMRNSEAILELREQLTLGNSAVLGNCSHSMETTNNALNSFRGELDAMDTKFDKRGDSRLRWGLGLAVTINFASISVIATVIFSLFNSTQAASVKLHEDVLVIKETVLINQDNIGDAERALVQLGVVIKEHKDDVK